jgi:hypothetical protein
MNKARQKRLTSVVQNLPAVCASIYHQFSNQQGGTYNRRVDTITQDQMDDRGIIPTSGGIAHSTSGGIVAMMGGINSTLDSITPMTSCIIPITGIIDLLMAVLLFQWWAAEFLQRVADIH